MASKYRIEAIHNKRYDKLKHNISNIINENMDTLKSMEVFRTIVEKGSFVKASEHLHISKPMTSKHLAHLENHLSAKLLNRNNRNQTLTEVGAKYYAECCAILDAVENAKIEARQGAKTPQGVLKIAAPVWLANPHIVSVFEGFEAKYPDIKLVFHLDNSFTDLISGGYDIGIRASHRDLPDNIIARPITKFELNFVATPAYLKKYGTPNSKEELIHHHGLLPDYTNVDTVLPQTHTSNNTLMLYEMAMANMGIAVMPEWVTRTAIEEGKMIKLFPVYDTLLTLYAVYMDRTLLSKKVRIFLDFIIEKAEERQRTVAKMQARK